jgi:hypothetical protein
VAVRIGRVLFGVSMAAFGLQSLVYADGVFGLGPAPRWILAPRGWSYLTGLVLLASGVSLAIGRRTRWAGAASGLVLGAWVLMLQLPPLLASLRDGGRWTTTFEALALCGAAWVLAGAARAGRFAYAASLPVFAVLHFVYHDYVASVIPAWIPGHAFWTYATALAFIAAAVSIARGLWDRLGAMLLGVMFGSWVLIVHAPRVAAAPQHRPEWTSLLVALAMSGGAWIIAGTPGRPASTP